MQADRQTVILITIFCTLPGTKGSDNAWVYRPTGHYRPRTTRQLTLTLTLALNQTPKPTNSNGPMILKFKIN